PCGTSSRRPPAMPAMTLVISPVSGASGHGRAPRTPPGRALPATDGSRKTTQSQHRSLLEPHPKGPFAVHIDYWSCQRARRLCNRSPQENPVHHGRRLAVTAGATVLGLAAMSGVSYAETSTPPAERVRTAEEAKPPGTSKTTKTTRITKTTRAAKAGPAAKTRKGAEAPALDLRLGVGLGYDERTRTASAGLDLGAGVRTSGGEAGVRVKTGVSASPAEPSVKAGAEVEAKAK